MFQRDFVNFEFQLHFRIQKDKNLLKGKKFFDKKKTQYISFGRKCENEKRYDFFGYGFYSFLM